jgi:hypothetical protein
MDPKMEPGQGQDDIQAVAAGMAAEIPDAERPVTRALVEQVVDAFNDAKAATYDKVMAATGQGEVPPMPVPGGDSFQKLPAEVYVPAALLIREVGQLVPEVAQKYACDPATLGKTSGIRALAAKLALLAKDEKVEAAIRAAAEKGKGAAVEKAAPMPTPDEDRAYAEKMTA